jgi:hypothetical protein
MDFKENEGCTGHDLPNLACELDFGECLETASFRVLQIILRSEVCETDY